MKNTSTTYSWVVKTTAVMITILRAFMPQIIYIWLHTYTPMYRCCWEKEARLASQAVIHKNYPKAVILCNGSNNPSEYAAIEQQILSRFIKNNAASTIKGACLCLVTAKCGEEKLCRAAWNYSETADCRHTAKGDSEKLTEWSEVKAKLFARRYWEKKTKQRYRVA